MVVIELQVMLREDNKLNFILFEVLLQKLGVNVYLLIVIYGTAENIYGLIHKIFEALIRRFNYVEIVL